MTERERIVQEMAEEILLTYVLDGATESLVPNEWEKKVSLAAADAALRVIERKADPKQADYSGICNCGESGYGENSPHSNHPHRKGCPQYTGRYE